MACVSFLKSQGIDPKNTTIDTVTSTIFAQGIGCINANQTSCINYCADLTKSETACYSCLAQSSTCGDVACRGETGSGSCLDPQNINAKGCCPSAAAAVECGTCLAKNGQSMDGLQSCLKETGLSSTDKIIIIVCSIVGFLILVIAISVSVVLKQKSDAKKRLIENLEKKGVSADVIERVKQLKSADIDATSYKAVSESLYLNKKGSVDSSTVQTSQQMDDLII